MMAVLGFFFGSCVTSLVLYMIRSHWLREEIRVFNGTTEFVQKYPDHPVVEYIKRNAPTEAHYINDCYERREWLLQERNNMIKYHIGLAFWPLVVVRDLFRFAKNGW